jgi:hypothetical protein
MKLMLVSAALLCGSLATAAEIRPALTALPPDMQDLLKVWQRQDCRIDDQELVKTLIGVGSILEEALWEAYDLGPPADVREELTSTLSERWLARHRWLEENGNEVIGREMTTELLAESEDDFRLEEDVKLTSRWRDAAVSGLGWVCTDRSVRRLESIARDERSPSSIAARAALEASGYCSRR